jgi:hypothetical protein
MWFSGAIQMRRFRIEDLGGDRNYHLAVLSRQYVVRHQEEFITSFDPDEGETVESVVDDLVTYFPLPDGEGYDYTDMVVWQNERIVAVVRRGEDGQAEAIIF